MASETFKTDSNIPVKRVFTNEDLKNYHDLLEEEPGRYPYTHGPVSGHVSRATLDHATVTAALVAQKKLTSASSFC